MKMFLLMAILLAMIIVPVVGMALINDLGSSAPSQSSAIVPPREAQAQGGTGPVPRYAAVAVAPDVTNRNMEGSGLRGTAAADAAARSADRRSRLSELSAPKPLTMMLLGTVLVGLAGWGRKKFRR